MSPQKHSGFTKLLGGVNECVNGVLPWSGVPFRVNSSATVAGIGSRFHATLNRMKRLLKMNSCYILMNESLIQSALIPYGIIYRKWEEIIHFFLMKSQSNPLLLFYLVCFSPTKLSVHIKFKTFIIWTVWGFFI